MNKGLAVQRTEAGEVEVISAAQGKLIDRVKVYRTAFDTSVGQSKGYAYLCGKTLLALKETVPHGQFEALKDSQFPDSRSALGRFMQFAEAVDYSNIPTLGFLEGNQLLLSLPEAKQAKVIEIVDQVTGGRGLVETITEWRKQVHKAKPVEPTSPVEEARQRRAAFTRFIEDLTTKLAMLHTIYAKEASVETEDVLSRFKDELIAAGHFIAQVRKERKKSNR